MTSGTQTVSFADLADLIGTQVDPRDQPDSLYVGLEHVGSGRFTRIGGGFAADVQSSKFAFREGDVLYGKLRPYLDKAILAEQDGVCTTELLVLRAREGIDPRFLIAVVHCKSFIEHAISGTTGSQHPRTSWHRISEFRIPAFSLEERTKITNVVWTIHNSLLICEEAIATASHLKRVAMQGLFMRGLRGEAQKDTEIGLVPESWEVERLDHYANVISTRMSYSELEQLEPTEDNDRVNVLGIKVGDMNRPGNEVELHHAELERLVPRAVAEHRCAPPRTIIFPKRGAAIATNKKRISYEWTAFDPNVIGVISQDKVYQEYLFHWFQGFDLRTITEPGPTPQLNKKNLEPVMVPVPPTLEEQREIVAILSTIDRQIGLHQRKRVVLEDLFKALLHKLMAGEIRVADVDLSVIDKAPLEGVAA
jgi:type I restriction enzyme S subunit